MVSTGTADDTAAAVPPAAANPYATGGGGVTFERKVAVQYLAHLLVGDGAQELGDGRRVLSVGFQRSSAFPVDDLVVTAACEDEPQATLSLALAVRRVPKLVQGDRKAQKLVRQFVRTAIDAPEKGTEQRWGLVVAGQQAQAAQVAELADLAAGQMDAPGFFDLVRTPGRFGARIRGRLEHLEGLVEHALRRDGEAAVDAAQVEFRTWQVLSRLSVLMPRLESPDEADWSGVLNSLIAVARDSDLSGASNLRDRLLVLAGDYSAKSARVDLGCVRRDVHSLLDVSVRRNRAGWRVLHHLHDQALASVRDVVGAADDIRRLSLDRSVVLAGLQKAAEKAEAVVVTGESGVGKSALATKSLASAGAADPDTLQVLCLNLRHVSKRTVDFDARLERPLAALLAELSAPQRVLVVDGADAVAEGAGEVFRYILNAAQRSGVKAIAVTSDGSKRAVREDMVECFGGRVREHSVAPLTDAEIDEIVGNFPELKRLSVNKRSRALLRRLVVADLLVRGSVRGVPLTEADAMEEVWSGLVRQRERPGGGSPDARESALLRLAEAELDDGNRLDVVSRLDARAVEGLRRDGLLRTSPDRSFWIGPEFGHDEIRRYAVARLLLANEAPASKLREAGVPRWALSAGLLACRAWLGRPPTGQAPLKGRFVSLQRAFDGLVDDGHSARWGDVPGEALLGLADSEELLRDAWPALLKDDCDGLQRLARLIDQRFHDENGLVDILAVEPVIKLMLEEDGTPWGLGKFATELFRAWLRAHVIANTEVGYSPRLRLRELLVAACEDADRRAAEKRAEALRLESTPEAVERVRQLEKEHPLLFTEIGYGDGRQRPKRSRGRHHGIPDKVVLELLALLGPDLGSSGEAILRRVADDTPASLVPVVEEVLADRAVASYCPRLLAELTEAYYIERNPHDIGVPTFGIRGHRGRGSSLSPPSAWYRGPFKSLFQSDFRSGVSVLNRLLNHAVRVRASAFAPQDQRELTLDAGTCGGSWADLEIDGSCRRYIGDYQAWFWYRGTAAGPFPCFSALQALERSCDELIRMGVPVRKLVSTLLDGCENLPMVGLVLGILVRHLEKADDLLDSFLAEPIIWRLEFLRVIQEKVGLAAGSEELVEPERRGWSLRDAGFFLTVRATGERVAELREVGECLVANARRRLCRTSGEGPLQSDRSGRSAEEERLADVRRWASSLDRQSFRVRETSDGAYIQPGPSEDVVQSLLEGDEDRKRSEETARLLVRYYVEPRKGSTESVEPRELAGEIATARKLLDRPPSLAAQQPWDAPALVASKVLEAHVLGGTAFPEEDLAFATEVLIRIGEGAAWPRPFEFAETYYEQAADRTAARTLPLLLAPEAASLRTAVDKADGWTAFDRVADAGFNLAEAVADEVRLNLARGLDPVWAAPCPEQGRCHHETGWRMATKTISRCVMGDWDPETGRRRLHTLEEPMFESLARVDGRSILVTRLDAAIRALAPAAVGDICVSAKARKLLLSLLDAQRRCFLGHPHPDLDGRGSHTLVAARALLTLAEQGDDAPIYECIDAYADNSELLGKVLFALSAAAEETPARASTARRVWPDVVRYVLKLHDSRRKPFESSYYDEGGGALARLMPNVAPDGWYFYRELQGTPIKWWRPLVWRPELEAWLRVAEGRDSCVDQLVRFLYVLKPEDQVREGLPWVARLVLADPSIAARTYVAPDWLIERRREAENAGVQRQWQDVVDALVVAGVTRLAPYSD